MSGRVGWHTYFMNIARQAATRSTCDRKHVGAVIVRDKTILSTGYNGSVRGMPHCDEVGHLMEGGHCVATVHAEANAIIQAAKNGVRIEGPRSIRRPLRAGTVSNWWSTRGFAPSTTASSTATSAVLTSLASLASI